MSDTETFDAANRSDADYAIEFGEYMAKTVDYAISALSQPHGDEDLSEILRALRVSVHEFRKRARKVPTAWLGGVS